MSEHTEGPWVVVEDAGTAVVTLAAVPSCDVVIAELPRAHHANARLIATAPIMLDLLRRATFVISRMRDNEDWDARAVEDEINELLAEGKS